METIKVIDSHTGGEPTRLVIEGGPDLGRGNLAERARIFRERHDAFRSAVINEPRGSDVIVGGLLCEPADPTCTAGVIYFNNVGTIGMCGHGTIGVAVTLGHMGRIQPGTFRLETPVGIVAVTLEDDRHHATIENVASYRLAKDVEVDVPGLGKFQGDVAYGGNWFFFVKEHREELALANVERLTEITWRIRQALPKQGITGANGAEIDHIELFGPSKVADSQNFVLCPGKAYDRSPCGTGTSAKVACLAADGKLKPGEVLRQESIVGSIFEGSYRPAEGGKVIPRIRGSAYVTAEATLLLDPADPFRDGIG